MKVYHPIISILADKTIHNYLISVDPSLQIVFTQVGIDSFDGLPKPPYVALIGAVIGQIIRYTQAKSVRSNLYRLCGSNFDTHTIASLSRDQWREIGLTSDKLNIIYKLNNYIVDNNIELNTVEDIQKLKRVEGIGDWTIETTILTSFLDWDTFPSGDLFVRKKIKKLYNLPKIPTIKQVKDISERWLPYRSIVTWYLWRWFD